MKEPWAWNRSQSNFSSWWAGLSRGQWSEVLAYAIRTQRQPATVTWAPVDQGKPSMMAVSAVISWWGGLSATCWSFILYFLKIKVASDLWINLLLVSWVGDAVSHSDKQLGPRLLIFFMGDLNLCLWLKSRAWTNCELTGEFPGCICRSLSLHREFSHHAFKSYYKDTTLFFLMNCLISFHTNKF